MFRFYLILILFALGSMYGCHPVPEAIERPVVTTYWDTVGRTRPLLLPGDSLLVVADMASHTEVNDWLIEAYRLSMPYLEYLGPDTDFVYRNTQTISGRLNSKLSHILPISSRALPGNYRLLCRVRDSNQKWSDSAKSSFFLVRYDYPVLVMNAPVANGSITRFVKDTAKFKLRAAGYALQYISFQWFDSTRTITMAPTTFRNMVGDTNDLRLDSFILGSPAFPPKVNLQIGLKNADGREMRYWLPYSKN